MPLIFWHTNDTADFPSYSESFYTKVKFGACSVTGNAPPQRMVISLLDSLSIVNYTPLHYGDEHSDKTEEPKKMNREEYDGKDCVHHTSNNDDDDGYEADVEEDYQSAVDDVEIYMISSDESDEDEVITINSDDEEAIITNRAVVNDIDGEDDILSIEWMLPCIFLRLKGAKTQ